MNPCPHRPPCPGCPRYGEPGLAPTALATLDTLAAQHGLDGVATVASAATGFRLRARLAIRGSIGAPKVGMFEAGSHRVLPIPQCVVQHPLVNHVAEVVRRSIADTGLSCYSERTQRGLARYLQVVVERATQTAQVVLVGNAESPEPFEPCLHAIERRLGNELHSLWFNENQSPGNAILGPRFHRRCGPASVVERFAGGAVHYPPGAFGQNNLDVAEQIVAHVRERVPEGSRAVEFYAGVGAIGLSILPRVRSLVMNEIAPASLEGLDSGLAELAPDDRARISVLRGAAASAAHAVTDADVVIVDPPRKGLDAPLVEALVTHPPARLLYVSCGLPSLLRDTAQLTADGRLRLAELTAFDLMPYTEHVETVARFERA